jgi:hypothetical protein
MGHLVSANCLLIHRYSLYHAELGSIARLLTHRRHASVASLDNTINTFGTARALFLQIIIVYSVFQRFSHVPNNAVDIEAYVRHTPVWRT